MTRFEIEGLLVKTHYLLACFLLLCVPNSSATVSGWFAGLSTIRNIIPLTKHGSHYRQTTQAIG